MRIRSWRRAILRIAAAAFLASLPFGHVGCIGGVAHLLYIINGGDKVPARYEGLEDQKVAVVCRSLDSPVGVAPEAELLAQRLRLLLKREVDGIELIRQDEIGEWLERHDGSQDYVAVGKAVKADKVLVVEMGSYALNDDPTLYQGHADLELVVYDVEKEDEVFRHSMVGFQYPKNGGQHVSETTLNRFELKFLMFTAVEISKNFYAYNIEEDFGNDATVNWD